MASNKNQHYVPQCYLKNFATDDSKASICLYNLDRKKLVKTAPIKNQCSKNYFYGEDLVLEKALQPIEGRFSAMVRTIEEPNYILNEKDEAFLKQFWLLQYLRTEAASRRNVELIEGMSQVTGTTDFKLEIKDAVQQSMRSFFDVKYTVSDLKVCLVKNNTSTDFITSDDPAVLTNWWHLLDKRAKLQSFGLGSAGCLLILPLSPKVLMVAYDGDVYSLPNNKGWLRLKSKFDVDSFNYLQVLNCRANLYGCKTDIEEYFVHLHDKVIDIKPKQRHKINYAILDEVSDGAKRYKLVESPDVEEHEEALVHCQPIYVAPPTWPRAIKWKNKGFVVTNGTGAGFVRLSRVQEIGTRDFYKLPSREA
ncbi:DUF4238 domain-containing protein [Vibrio cholerae]|uniref:DUF4238 domain-containing protein n=2 Tax=Vibrio cholerae TaxID=666 RepID=UPI000E0A203A|nr:DUF4238 domain-containing protein [Vibrio cholerae]EGR4126252.1 DUF4238 domain-containing protein [Vibrio cholerae]MBJ6911030.1 DUF4238 domain-containing protein [Vibrio cholerae]RNE57734.1 DUF4238 domain-containing protein [Vibrio cholerae]GHY93244.1 hypothetical protein VCSRO75_3402 [Vibrio cholerae]HDI3182367.1 DUF4238 domain-containing protein [Vibrio cholerae]